MGFRHSHLQGIGLEAVLAEPALEKGKGKGCRAPGFSWRSLCATREVYPNSQGTVIDAGVNLLQTPFTECFRDKP